MYDDASLPVAPSPRRSAPGGRRRLPPAQVILNPAAGSAEDLAAMEGVFADFGSFELHPTSGEGDAERMARELADRGATRFVAAGGDGTLNEVLNGLRDVLDLVELGLVPLGTGNDFARTLGIPSDIEGAIAVLLSPALVRLDAYRVVCGDRDRLALNASSGGFSAKVGEAMTRAAKERFGAVAYILAAGKALPDLQTHDLRLVLDDDRTEQVASLSLVVANGRFIGGGIPVAPDADLMDGLLDLLVVPALPLAELAAAVVQILRGTHSDNPALLRRRARRLRLESSPPLELTLDGEPWGSTPAEFEVLPGAVRFLGPGAQPPE